VGEEGQRSESKGGHHVKRLGIGCKGALRHKMQRWTPCEALRHHAALEGAISACLGKLRVRMRGLATSRVRMRSAATSWVNVKRCHLKGEDEKRCCLNLVAGGGRCTSYYTSAILQQQPAATFQHMSTQELPCWRGRAAFGLAFNRYKHGKNSKHHRIYILGMKGCQSTGAQLIISVGDLQRVFWG